MPITTENLYNHELIGLESQIVSSTQPELTGLCGSVVFETKNTLCIMPKQANNNDEKISFTSIKSIPKKIATWRFVIPQSKNKQEKEVDGTLIQKRPQDRVMTAAKSKKKEMKQ